MEERPSNKEALRGQDVDVETRLTTVESSLQDINPTLKNLLEATNKSSSSPRAIPRTIPLLVNQAVLGQNLPPAVLVIGGLPPVPGWLVTMIHKNQYVDFALLRLCNLNVLPNIAPTGVQLSRLLRLELQPILTFIDWAEAWAVYSSIVAQKHADKLGDLLHYFLLISKANRDVQGAWWLAYDTAFRRHATGNTSVLRTMLDPTLYMSTVVADGVNNQVRLPSASAYPSSSSMPRSRQRKAS